MTNKILLSTQVDVAQLVEETIVTALEGGSNYWYWLHLDQNWFEVAKRYDIQLSKKETPIRTHALPLTMRIANALVNVEGYELPIYDLEEPDELLGKLTLDGFVKGCEKCIRDYPNTWAAFMGESYDACDADVLFQLAIFGEVKFG